MSMEAEGRFSRTALLYGEEAVKALAGARVAVFGLGGVGGYIVEALARSGIGALKLVDHDKVTLSNLNRQIIATERTIGRYKVDAARDRVLEINPGCAVTTHRLFFLPETAEQFDFSVCDYVADAVDNITAKLTLIECARHAGVPVISAMGTGNKLDPSMLKVADIYDTAVCPLARVMRKECRRRGIESLKVVYSAEEPMETRNPEGETVYADQGGVWKRVTPASNAMVPATAGLLMASEIINDLIQKYR